MYRRSSINANGSGLNMDTISRSYRKGEPPSAPASFLHRGVGQAQGGGVMQSVGKCGMFKKNVNDRTGDPREGKGCTERHRHTSRKNTSIIFAFEILLISSVLASEPARPQPTLTIMIFCFSSADRPAQNGGQSERHAERYNLHAQKPKSKSNNSSNTNKRRNVIRFFIVPHPVR